MENIIMMMKYTLLLSLLLPINTALFCAHGGTLDLPDQTEIEAFLQEITPKDTASQEFKFADLTILECTEAEKEQLNKTSRSNPELTWFKFQCQYCPEWVCFQSQNPPIAKTIYNTTYKHEKTCGKPKNKICSMCGASFQTELIFKEHLKEHKVLPKWKKSDPQTNKDGTSYYIFTTECPDCQETITLRTAQENLYPSQFDKPLKSHAKKCTGKQPEANNLFMKK